MAINNVENNGIVDENDDSKIIINNLKVKNCNLVNFDKVIINNIKINITKIEIDNYKRVAINVTVESYNSIGDGYKEIKVSKRHIVLAV